MNNKITSSKEKGDEELLKEKFGSKIENYEFKEDGNYFYEELPVLKSLAFSKPNPDDLVIKDILSDDF